MYCSVLFSQPSAYRFACCIIIIILILSLPASASPEIISTSPLATNLFIFHYLSHWVYIYVRGWTNTANATSSHSWDRRHEISRLHLYAFLFILFTLATLAASDAWKILKEGSGIFVKKRIGMKHLLCWRISLFVWLVRDLILSSVSQRHHHPELQECCIVW